MGVPVRPDSAALETRLGSNARAGGFVRPDANARRELSIKRRSDRCLITSARGFVYFFLEILIDQLQ
jgi:hypothetical protein